MATYKTYKFQDLTQLEHHLNGGVRTGASVLRGFFGLVGKTIIFGNPVANYTFVAGAHFSDLTFAEVKAQIEAAFPTITVLSINDQLAFIEATPSMGLTITGGTGLAILGCPGGATGRVYEYLDGSPGVAPPYWITSYPMGNYHVLIVRE